LRDEFAGEVITSLSTRNTYTIGEKIGEGHFGIVYACKDVWQNELAAKVLKPLGTYETVRTLAESELTKLFHLRHPNITYVYDAFEYRDTFYIITEKCFCPVTSLFGSKDFNGQSWLLPVARCILQALHFVHVNSFVHQDIHPGNVFTAFVKDELPTEARAIQFKLGDLGVAKLATEVNAQNTRAEWLLPPEVLRPSEFGEVDYRIDIYHVGLLFLQLAYSKELRFTKDEILQGKPREMALALPPPLSFGLEKSLRRHVAVRTSSAMELWRDLNTPPPSQQAKTPAFVGK
jgi:serine/threonine-protein kinase